MLCSSVLSGVSLGGGKGGWDLLKTARTAEGLTGTGMMEEGFLKMLSSGKSFIFSRLDAVVVVELELELSVSVLELSVIPSSSSCRSQVSVSISWTTCMTRRDVTEVRNNKICIHP